MFLIGSQKSKNKKIWKPQKQKTTTRRKQDAKQNKSKIAIQDKTRQQAEKQEWENILKLKANKPITKSKNQKVTWETGSKEER